MDPKWLSVLADPGAWFWWVGAGVLLVIELMSGTFYLLMIALGFLAAGLLRLGGGAGVTQVIAAAVLSALAIVAVRLVKRRCRHYRALRASDESAMHDPAANLDIGATVHVAHWLDRRARTVYRGAQWDAVLIDGADDRPGWYRINRIEGIRLVLEPTDRQ